MAWTSQISPPPSFFFLSIYFLSVFLHLFLFFLLSLALFFSLEILEWTRSLFLDVVGALVGVGAAAGSLHGELERGDGAPQVSVRRRALREALHRASGQPAALRACVIRRARSLLESRRGLLDAYLDRIDSDRDDRAWVEIPRTSRVRFSGTSEDVSTPLPPTTKNAAGRVCDRGSRRVASRSS